MQVEPQTSLPAVYQIEDHTDTNRDSYYVRAIVRDSSTGTTIQALNLVSAGSGRYVKNFNAPADIYGNGRQIDVTITVYTDSGYTTKSELYGQTIEKWYVKAQPVHYAGSSGAEVDYKRIERIIADTVKAAFAEQEGPEAYSDEQVVAGLQRIEQLITSIEIPEHEPPEPIDLSPVHGAIAASHNALQESIQGIEMPETDLSPVIEGMQNLAEAIGELKDLSDSQKEELGKTVQTTLTGLYAKHTDRINRVKDLLSEITADDGEASPAPKKPKLLSPYLNK